MKFTELFAGVSTNQVALQNINLPQELLTGEVQLQNGVNGFVLTSSSNPGTKNQGQTPAAKIAIGFVPTFTASAATPRPSENRAQPAGTTAPIAEILTRSSDPIPGARIVVSDVDGLPANVPTLPAGLVVNSLFTLTPENFQPEDMIANHLTFFVEKEWLAANELHPWSIQFNRYDEEKGRWVPLLGKLINENEERIFYTVSPPEFSLWAITGAKDVPPVRFQSISLSISPAQPGRDRRSRSRRLSPTSPPSRLNTTRCSG